MGFSPREVDDMTLWEFTACYEGYRAANSTEPERPVHMSEDRMRELGIEGI